MAELTTLAQTFSNAGVAIPSSALGANAFKHVINQADIGRELFVKVFKEDGLVDSDITKIRFAITLAGGVSGVLPANTGDAFTVAAIGTADGMPFVSGVTDTVFMRVQGTGVFNLVDAADDTEAEVTVEAEFTPAI